MCIGATSASLRGPVSGGYFAVVERYLEAAFKGLDVQVVHRGVSGELAADAAERIKTEVALTNADLVLWQLGTADALAPFRGGRGAGHPLASENERSITTPVVSPRIEKSSASISEGATSVGELTDTRIEVVSEHARPDVAITEITRSFGRETAFRAEALSQAYLGPCAPTDETPGARRSSGAAGRIDEAHRQEPLALEREAEDRERLAVERHVDAALRGLRRRSGALAAPGRVRRADRGRRGGGLRGPVPNVFHSGAVGPPCTITCARAR